jgi:pimeloyl-ACP methyl ester carboxylesterase
MNTSIRFLSAVAVVMAAVLLASNGSAKAQSGETKIMDSLKAKKSTNAFVGNIKQISAGVLNVGYIDEGPANGPVVLLLHGWPYDINSFADVAPLLVAKGYRVIIPYLRGFGTTRFISDKTFRNGQQSVIALDMIALMDALQIKKAIIAGFDWGARTADIMAALWPERCEALVSVSGYLIVNRETNLQPLPPKAELGWWYQYYFATERGKAGYGANRRDFNQLIWKLASPKWDFADATFERSAAAFNNPDHVSIVIHNYRWRLSMAKGDPQYDALEEKLAKGPVITVPAITISSDFDGARANGAAYAKKFSGRYAHWTLNGIGHDVPQEAPEAFADAILEAGNYSRSLH